jgi:hypothetical protein
MFGVALDARADYEAFSRFAELVSGQTAIAPNRFSTVRRPTVSSC